MRNTLCEQMFSASPPNSDIPRCGWHFAFVPETEVRRAHSITSSAPTSLTVLAHCLPSPQALAQKDARRSRTAVNLTKCLVAMTLIEFRRREADRGHLRLAAAPSPSLGFCLLHDAAAKTLFAQGGREKE